jgi:hypothetical protein
MTFAIAALRGFLTNPSARGLWISDDFGLDGPRPTWTKIDDGLEFDDGSLAKPQVMAVDPTYPYDIQYIRAKNVIFKRNSGAFYKILDLDDVYQIFGYGPSGRPSTTDSITWVTCDPMIPGRVYAVYSYLNMDAAWWKDSWQVLWPGGWVLASDDHGETWYNLQAPIGPFKSKEPEPGPAISVVGRGALEVQGIGGNIWVSASQPNLYGEGVLTYAKKGILPSNWEQVASPGNFSFPMGSLLTYPYAKIDPSFPLYCYTAVTTKPYGLYRVLGGPPERTTPQYNYELFPCDYALGHKRSSDCHWINPTDSGDQIIITKNGQIVSVHYVHPPVSLPVFSSDGIEMTPGGLYTGNLNLLPGDNYQSIFFTSRDRVYGLEDRTSRNPIELGQEGRAWHSAAFANYGLYVDPGTSTGILGHPFVFSVELGENGTDDTASAGKRLMGSDSAFNTVQQPDLHARDIKELMPTVHAPWPAKDGEAPVSDGEKYVPTPVAQIKGMIARYPHDGSAGVIYDFSADALNDASEDAEEGDKIEVMGAGELVGDLYLTAQVEYIGSKNIIVSGSIFGADGAILSGFTIKKSSNGTDDLFAVDAPSAGVFWMYNCDATAFQEGSGNAYGLNASQGGNIQAIGCNVTGISLGGSGYAGRSINGKIRAKGGGKYYGSTDWFLIEEL